MKKQFKFTIGEKEHQEFKAICKKRKITLSKVFRNIIKRYLDYERSKKC